MRRNMNHDKPKQAVKTLSIRIPEKLYLMVSQYALDHEMPSMNAAIISLVTSGLSSTEERESIIGQFILELVPREKMEEIINGSA